MSQLLPERRSRIATEAWEPLNEFEQVTERMRRMLDQTFGSFAPSLLTEQRGWSPFVDIEEADDAYVLEAFDYRVTLPEHLDADKIDAKLADGVLTVRVPKSERAQRRKIEVKS